MERADVPGRHSAESPTQSGPALGGQAPDLGSPLSTPTPPLLPRPLHAEYLQKRKALLESFAHQLTELNNEYREAIRRLRSPVMAPHAAEPTPSQKQPERSGKDE